MDRVTLDTFPAEDYDGIDGGTDTETFEIGETDAGDRLDVFLARVMSVSRSAAATMIEDGRVTAGGKVLSKKEKLRVGTLVSVETPAPEPIEAIPQRIPIDVRYEDDDLIVVNKASGMVVHPAPGNPDGTLVNALLYHCAGTLSGIGGAIRPGIVHRIDKDTSGLLVVAKNDFTHRVLSDALKVHDVRRIYTAIAIGGFPNSSGTVDAPIGRHPQDRKRMAVLRAEGAHARNAVTHYELLEELRADGECFSCIRCALETGRTHQIRVHMASIGHPLLGDPVYGGARSRFQARHPKLFMGQMLHAGELSFVHPRTGERVTVTAPLPDHFERALALLRRE